MKPYRSATLQGQQPLIPPLSPTEYKQAQREKEDLKSRFELLNLKSPRFSLSSFSPSLKQPAPVHSSWLRDPTPPATPDPELAATRGGGLGGNNGRFPIPAGGKNSRGRGGDGSRICGLERRWFFGLLAVIGVVLLGLCIGVGVGVSQSKSNNSSHNSGSGGSSSGAQTVTATTTTSTTATSTLASATTTATGGVDCPAGNGTIYTVPGSTKQFMHICGMNYTDSDSTNIGRVQTNSMADCMTNCAGTYNCTGCGWGYLNGDSFYEHTCWLKSGLQASEATDSTWAFAILI